MMTDISIDKIQENLFDKLINTGWDHKLRFFIKSSDFYDIILSLHDEKSQGRRFSPPLRDIFRPFQLCTFPKLKVIFVAKEAHTDPTLTNGLAISHNMGLTSQYEFKAFYEELQRTVGNNSLLDGELSAWAKQGVLLLNTTLTTKVGYPNKHELIWRPWANFLFDVLNRQENLVWIFFGESDYWETVDSAGHIKIQVPELPDKRDGVWRSDDLFNKINRILVENKKEKIVW